jgi:Flp pilus assembly protein TadG
MRMTDLPAPSQTQPAQQRRRGLIRRFRRDQDGATAVEFAMVVTPFLAVLLAIIETALMFWTNQILEDAVTQASRTLLTGQSRELYPATNSSTTNTDAFRNAVCANAPALVTCDAHKLKIDVRSYASFAGAQTGTAGSNPVSGGALNTSGFQYNQTGPGQIIVVRAVLTYDLLLTQWSTALANIGGGQRALVASTTFRSEPFV